MFRFIKGALLVTGGMVLGSYFTVDAALKSEIIRKGLADAFAQKLSNALYSKQRPNNVSYVRYYKKAKPQNAISEICFDTWADAEKVLNEMKIVIKMYGSVSLADAYELSGEMDIPYDYNRFGWYDVSNARVRPARIRYHIELPPAIKM